MDDSRTVGTCTTRGGADFDDLASEKVAPYYAFRLLRLDKGWNLYKTRDELVECVDNTLLAVEIASGKKIAKFYIGKTTVRQWKKRQFNPMDRNTWRKERISSRWLHHKHQEYGKSGMVVLTVVSRENVSENSTPAFYHQELYALALEQQLIAHYAYIKCDKRLANESIHPGHQSRDTDAIGHPIYVAYSLEDAPNGDETANDQGATGEYENESDPNYSDNQLPVNSLSPTAMLLDNEHRPDRDNTQEDCLPMEGATMEEHESQEELFIEAISDPSEQFTMSPLAASNNPGLVDESCPVNLEPQLQQGKQLCDHSDRFHHQDATASPIVLVISSDSDSDGEGMPDTGMPPNCAESAVSTLAASCPSSSTPFTCGSHSSTFDYPLEPFTQTCPQASPSFACTSTDYATSPTPTSSGPGYYDTTTPQNLHGYPQTPPTNYSLGTLEPILLVTSSTTSQPTRGAVRKRRHRCRKCQPCLTPKCMECINCTRPHRRKPCVKRNCQNLTF